MTDKPKDPKGRTEPGYERHVFVCTNVREPGHVRGCCADKGGDAIRDRFKAGLVARGLKTTVRANKAGCLDFCEFGPCIVVYPEGVWYQIRDIEADVDEILDRHLDKGEVVERCVLRIG